MQIEWKQDPEFTGTWNAYNDDGARVAFVCKRPSYCDRGHYHAGIEILIEGMDVQDGFPRYYMRLETAKDEIERFLNWRIEKVRSDLKDEL